MKQITTFFSELSQQSEQTLKIYEKIATISQIWQSQILFYMH